MLEPEISKVRRCGRRVRKQHPSAYQAYNEACEDLFLPKGKSSQLRFLRCRSPSNEERLGRIESCGPSDEDFTCICDDLAPQDASKDEITTKDQDDDNYLVIDNAIALRKYLQTNRSTTAVWVPQKTSWSEFLVTRSLFETLCRELWIFDKLRDSIMHMGYRRCETEVAPFPLVWQTITGDTDSREVIGWECSYALRFIEENHYTDSYPWSLRQFAVYNQSIPTLLTSTWIFFSRKCGALADFECLNDSGKLRSSFDFELHLSFAETVTASWRPYLVYLAKQVNEHTTRVTFADPLHPQSHGSSPIDLGAEGTQLKLRNLSDHASNARTSLKGNDAQILALISILERGTLPIEQDNKDHAIDTLRDTVRQNATFQLQLSCIQEKLVTCADIVARFTELSNGQKLKELALTAQEGNDQTTILAKKTQRDAAAVKGLTVVAIIFLPPTAVLNFYSSCFVDGSSGRIQYLPDWWQFLAAGIPMSIGTLLLWSMWIALQDPSHINQWVKKRRSRCLSRKDDV